MDENSGKQNGFTLIEILLSIILLAIILTFFARFFTQSAIFTQKNAQKLSTMQTAQMIVNLIDLKVTMVQLRTNITDNSGRVIFGPIIDSSGNVVSNQQPADGTYHINGITDINTKLKISINTGYNVSLIIKNGPDSNNKLIQFKIIVSDTSDATNKSETYMYIRR